MQNPYLHNLLHAIGHRATHERAHGNTGRADGLSMIGMSIVLMSVPIVAVPLLVVGVCKTVKG